MANLQLKHIYKKYDNGHEAVNDFCIDIKDKEFIVFVGPSGCGKSTTLRMIAGLEDITSGELYIGDTLVNDVQPKDRDIAMVFQSYALYPHMTVYDNMAFGLRNKKVEAPAYDFKAAKEVTKKIRKVTKSLNRFLAKSENIKHVEDNPYKPKIEALGREKDQLEKKLHQIVETPVYGIDKEKIAKYTRLLNYANINKRKVISLKEKAVLNGELEDADEYDRQLEDLENTIKTLDNGIKDMKVNQKQLFAYRHYTEDEINKKVLEAAKILDIEEYLNRKPRAMSGGQRQRVALGRAIVRNPKVFLLDEPLSNLDAKLRGQMRTEITKLHKKLGTTFIYVTHDQVEAMTMGTRIVVMKLGFVQQIDTPMNLYNKPANKFVAGFIGTPRMNFFNVKLTKKADTVIVAFDDGQKLLMNGKRFDQLDPDYLTGKKDVILGARPEHFKVLKTRDGLATHINAIEHLGSETLVHVGMGTKEERFQIDNSKSIIFKTNGKNDFEFGDIVYLSFMEDEIHLFDAETEVSLFKD
mgnify:FL=1